MLGKLLSSIGRRASHVDSDRVVAPPVLEMATPAAPLRPLVPAPAPAPAQPPVQESEPQRAEHKVLDDLYYRRRHLELMTLQTELAAKQLVETLLARPALADPKRLERYGNKTFSQNDEDGIIAEIFRRIGEPHRTFVEFGCGDGLENNTSCLLGQGWRGLWMDGGDDNVEGIGRAYGHLIEHDLLKLKNVFIDRENIDGLIAGAGLGTEIDLLSIDLDGNDYYIWEAIRTVSARVVVIEYNGKFIPPNDWCMAYDPKHMWDGSDLMGSSLEALARLGESKGYQLVGCNITGGNAFFVRRDLAGDQFALPATASYLFQPARYDLTKCFKVGHPSKSLTILQGAYAAAGLAWPPAATVPALTQIIQP